MKLAGPVAGLLTQLMLQEPSTPVQREQVVTRQPVKGKLSGAMRQSLPRYLLYRFSECAWDGQSSQGCYLHCYKGDSLQHIYFKFFCKSSLEQ